MKYKLMVELHFRDNAPYVLQPFTEIDTLMSASNQYFRDFAYYKSSQLRTEPVEGLRHLIYSTVLMTKM